MISTLVVVLCLKSYYIVVLCGELNNHMILVKVVEQFGLHAGSERGNLQSESFIVVGLDP